MWLTRLRGTLRRFRFDLAIALLLAVLLGTAWIISNRVARQTERAGVDSAFAETRDLSRVMALEWSAILQQIDALQRLARLVTLAHLAGDPDEVEHLKELRQATAQAGGGILQVGAMDAAANLIWSTTPMPAAPVNLAGREHYLAIARDGNDHFVGRPVRGAVSGKWTIQFSEAVRGPDGALRGVTVVSVSAGWIEAQALDLGIADQGVVTLVRGDGVVLARSPNNGVGEDVRASSPLWRIAQRTGDASGLAPGPLDGVPRFYAARRIPGSDMVVVIGLDEAGQIAPVRAAIAQVRIWTAVATIALVGLAIAACVGIRRQRRMTAQRAQMGALAQRDTLLRQMTENLTDLICLHDSAGHYVEMGNAATALLGMPREDLLGGMPGKLVLPEDRPLLNDAWGRLLSDGRPQRLEFRIRRTDGEIRWLETEIMAVAAPTGTGCRPDRFLSATRDVTDRRIADRRLHMLVAAVPGVLMQSTVRDDGTMHLTYVSDAVSELLGCTPEVAMAPGFFEQMLTPEVRQDRRRAIAAAPDGGRVELSYRVCRQGGGFVWVQETAAVRQLPEGRRKLIAVLTDTTKQNQAEVKLAEARADLDTILADGPGVLFRIRVKEDGSVQPIYLSANAERVLGYSKEALLEPDYFNAICEMSSALAEARFHEQPLNDTTPLEFRYRPPDGGWGWLRSNIHPLRTGHQFVELVGVVIEITQERESAAALAKAQRQLDAFVDVGPGVLYRRIFETPECSRVVYVSPNVERVLGLSAADLMSIGGMEQRLDRSTVPPLAERMAQLVEYGESAYTARYRDRTGQWRWMSFAARLSTNEDGEAEMLGIGFDVTRERNAEEERDYAKAELSAMAMAGPGALYRMAVDATGTRRFVSLSDKFAELTGLPVATMLGDDLPADRLDPETLPKLEQCALEVQAGEKISHEYRFRHAAGHWIWVLDVATIVERTPDGGYDMIGYLTDITREKEMAAQVAQAGKMALLGEMATGMAHELNQPLTAISMAAENGQILLSMGTTNVARVRDKLDRITNQAHRASAIIDHMRIFGRRETGTQVPLPLADAVNGARLILDGRLRLDRIVVETDLPPDLPPVLAQSLPVEQVLVNLLGNACDAYRDAVSAPDRRIRISARASGGRVCLEVADRAGGVKDPSRVFEPFYTTKEVGQGTGLGLSISYGIISDLGGQLSVRNEDGGAVFQIDLPAAPQKVLC